MSFNHIVKFVSILVCALTISACALFDSSEINDKTSMTSNKPETITRVLFEKKCPMTKAGTQSIVGGLALALVPPLVESGIKGLGNAIKAAGAKKSYSTNAIDTINFYSLDKERRAFTANQSNSCIVIFRAKVNGNKVTDKFRESKIFSNRALYLFKKHGISDTPKFYFEAILIPSDDRSAFRLDPKMVFYGEKIGPNNDDKELVVNLTFSTPSSSVEGAPFAYASMTIDRHNGVYHVSGEELLYPYRSKYLPLPTPSSTASEAITIYALQATQLKDLKKQRLELDRKEDPGVTVYEKLIEDIKLKIESGIYIAEKNLAREISACEVNPECNIRKNESISELKEKLEDLMRNEKLSNKKMNLENKLKNRRSKLTSSVLRSNLDKSINTLENFLTLSEKILKKSTPVNVSATLTETTSANEFLIALGDALVGSAEAVKTKLTEKLTPVDEETELEKNITKLTALNTLRTTAITSVGEWSVINSEYHSAAIAKKELLLPGLRVAYFKAKLNCDIVNTYNIVEPMCLLLEEPPAS